MSTTLLIDADGLAFRAAAAVQTTIEWDEDLVTSHADRWEARDAFEYKLHKIRSAVDEDAEIVLCFSCPSRRYFRHDIFPDYKGNRKLGQSPVALKGLKEWASSVYKTWTKPSLEADDVLGILATHPKLIPGEKIIVSHDKDLEQIPGLHLHPERPHEGVYRVAPDYAKRFLATQILTGDSTDGYPPLNDPRLRVEGSSC